MVGRPMPDHVRTTRSLRRATGVCASRLRVPARVDADPHLPFTVGGLSMKPRITLALVAVGALACTETTAPPAPSVEGPQLAVTQASDVIPNQYIVVFRDGVPDVPGLAQRLAAAHGGKHRFTYQ